MITWYLYFLVTYFFAIVDMNIFCLQPNIWRPVVLAFILLVILAISATITVILQANKCVCLAQITNEGESTNSTHIDGLMQERCNSSALAMELHISCIIPMPFLHQTIDMKV